MSNNKIDNKKFLEYLKKNCPSNLNFIKSIRFNKKSISVKIEDKNFVFNGFFTEKTLYNIIIDYLSIYIKDNNLNIFNTVGIVYDKDYLKYNFKKLNVN